MVNCVFLLAAVIRIKTLVLAFYAHETQIKTALSNLTFHGGFFPGRGAGEYIFYFSNYAKTDWKSLLTEASKVSDGGGDDELSFDPLEELETKEIRLVDRTESLRSE